MIIHGGHKVDTMQFAGGERNPKVIESPYYSNIVAYLHSSNDIMDLLLYADAFDRSEKNWKNIIIPYLPYSRQDRVCHKGEALGIKVMADLLNSIKSVNKITIFDPHSDVAPALINNCNVKTVSSIFEDIGMDNFVVENNLSLISPDAGAEKKVRGLANDISLRKEVKVRYFSATKERDDSGKIVDTRINGDFANKDLMIVDDICDGGRTFIELAKKLKQKGCGKLYLYVTNGIFSNGFKELEKYFETIFCCFAFENKEKSVKLKIINPINK